ncbi:histidine phosphatase family protein [Brevundimonas intermedia]|uniref:Histidine phosphatase family protein n=1 Tax=Brevundimonas intermedia TaxID=74315 RepID=A0A4Y9RY81_9CAUL|nr:histidine phosphatase family protein [Brevundimonas intermedia]TFW14247.1 histidine phosphatase family protein [Brevundimonas intermedia]
MTCPWPARLWIVRHGQSAGNVARDLAHAAGLGEIDLDIRDVDVPLSDLGHAQSDALGRWFAALPKEDRPTVVLTSTYLRARQTAIAIAEAGGLARADLAFCVDERLREREFGVLDRLTTHGIAARYPEQAEARRRLGKFYHRPPGGESWCDVILRLRAALDTLSLHHRDERVLIVCHQVVVLCLRYLLESLTETEILAIDAEGDVANCGVTTYSRNGEDGLSLDGYNFVAPLEDQGTPVTSAPDAKVAAR